MGIRALKPTWCPSNHCDDRVDARVDSGRCQMREIRLSRAWCSNVLIQKWVFVAWGDMIIWDIQTLGWPQWLLDPTLTTVMWDVLVKLYLIWLLWDWGVEGTSTLHTLVCITMHTTRQTVTEGRLAPLDPHHGTLAGLFTDTSSQSIHRLW